MSEMSISVTQEELVLSVLRDLGNAQIEDATNFRFPHSFGHARRCAYSQRNDVAMNVAPRFLLF